MMKKQNENGSTIVTSIVIVMIIFVILGTALAIAISYQKRSINEHARKQAYLNGISVVNSIAGQLNETNGSKLIPTDHPIVITNVSLPDTIENGQSVSHGGSVTAKIIKDTKDEQLIYIQVTSVYNQQTEEVQLTMQKYNEKWYQKIYSKIGETFSDENKS